VTHRATGRHDHDAETSHRPLGRRWWVVGLAIAALVVVVLAPLASADPDGLERVATDLGFGAPGVEGPAIGPLPDYTIPGLADERVSTVVAGLVGILIVVGAMWLLGRLLARRRTR
jgi:hypothetical protein